MSKNVVRKANKTIIDKILREILDKVQIAQYYKNNGDLTNANDFLHIVSEYRQTVCNLDRISVFNGAEYSYFVNEYVTILIDHDFTVRDVWNAGM